MFDCRALPNQVRLEEFKSLSGKNKHVIQYLKEKPVVTEFVNKTSELVKSSAKKHIERGFANLMVCYGCTGEQHRTVYCAENPAQILKKELYVIVDLKHEEEEV